MSDVAARLEAAIKAGNVPDDLLAEAEAEAQARGLQVHSPAQDGAPELMTSSTDDLAANQRAVDEAKKNRLSALDAGEADAMFEAARPAGQQQADETKDAYAARGGKAGKVGGEALRWRLMYGLGASTPAGMADRARLSLREKPEYLQERAVAGDKEAEQQLKADRYIGKVRGTAAGTGLGLLLGPAGSTIGALARGAAAGGVGAGVESATVGDEPRTVAKKAGGGALSGAALNVLIHGVGSFGAGMNKSLRENPDIGRDIQLAEKGGYKTSVTRGLKPPGPTGKTPGKYGVEEQAADIAPQAMGRAGSADEALIEAHRAADEAYYASQAGQQQVDSTPIVKAFKGLVEARTFRDGKPIPESMAGRLMDDAKAFAHVERVPVEQAEQMAAKSGGIVIRPQARLAGETGAPQLGPHVPGEPAIPVTPGGRVMTGETPAVGPFEGPPAARQMPGPDTALATREAPGSIGGRAGKPWQAPGGRKAPVSSDDVGPVPPPPGRGGTGSVEYIPPGQPRGEQQYAYVLVPRKLNARELESVRNTFDSAGNAAGRSTEETAPFMEIANQARGMRSGFPGLEEMRAGQSSQVGQIKNLRKALGIPESKRLDANDLGELQKVGDAIQRYKAPGNLEADRVIDDFLAKNPDLKPAFEKLSAMSAAERVRGAGPTGRVGIGGGGLRGMLADTILGSRLRIDPAMAALARLRGGSPMVAGAAGNAAGGFAPDVEQKIRQMLMRQPAQGEQP